MIRPYFRFSVPISALLVLLLAAPLPAQTEGQDGGLWLPEGASTYTDEVDFLYKAIFWVTTGMFVLTEGLLLLFCIIYRRREGHRPQYTHGSRTAEITWTIVPALMLLGLAVWQIPTWDHIKKDFPPPGPGVTEVKVLAEQYTWNFMYPGTKDRFEAEYDASTIKLLHLPFGDKALLHLRSKDVIHSLFIPHMRVKQDVVPGIRLRTWFEPSRMKLIEIHGPQSQDGRNPDRSPRMVQPFVWVNDPKEFEAGGAYFNERIAVSAVQNYVHHDGLYRVLDRDGTPHPVRVLHQGKIMTGQSWESCKYALGIFDIACAELCGMGHYGMKAYLVVEPRSSYENWLEDQLGEAAPVWAFWKD